MSHKGLELRPTYIVHKASQVELRGRAVQHADAKLVIGFITVGPGFLANAHAMASVLVGKERRVDKGPICVNFVELPIPAMNYQHVSRELRSRKGIRKRRSRRAGLPSDDLILLLIRADLTLAFIRGQAHFSPERRLSLFNAANLVSLAQEFASRTKGQETIQGESQGVHLRSPKVEGHLRYANLTSFVELERLNEGNIGQRLTMDILTRLVNLRSNS